ncbi:Integral membrane protein DGCR2/IDD [Microtus ochrogaster]|uniref:Integral membrane protein DGCR2/IDD n=1 Tax=Microtus ochrogaster TaxID=79684 RepID=A0A8J6G1P4_MICOH|nr:Integral membrane protein DGCR2/IDD [Microtus ochrogaster]
MCSDLPRKQIGAAAQHLDYLSQATLTWIEFCPRFLLLCHFFNSLLPFCPQSFGATLGSFSVTVVPSSAYPSPGNVMAGQRVRIRAMKPTVQRVQFYPRLFQTQASWPWLWVGYQYVITGRNHSLEGRWEVAFKGSSEVFLPPDPIFASAMSESDTVFCAQLQCFHFPTLRHHDLHSWHAESCSEKSSFLCKRSESQWSASSGL